MPSHNVLIFKSLIIYVTISNIKAYINLAYTKSAPLPSPNIPASKSGNYVLYVVVDVI